MHVEDSLVTETCDHLHPFKALGKGGLECNYQTNKLILYNIFCNSIVFCGTPCPKTQ